MASVFTKILSGELPGRVVWQDDEVAALLTNRPIRPGHALVVPKREIDHWVDVPAPLNARLFEAAQRVGRAIQATFPCAKVGVAVVGLEVRHVHLHLVPIDAVGDLDFAKQDPNPDHAALDEAARRLRDALSRD
jgi:histidine triad (HIT) family protein